jgi:hypothetical protein
MRPSRFRVYGRFDSASAVQVATITIDRDTKVFKVRPLRRRRSYDLDLATVAAIVCQKVIAYEVMEKRRAKAERRRARKAA